MSSWEGVCSGRLQDGLTSIGSPGSESCLLSLMQQKVFFVIIFSFLFSPGIIGALGVDKYRSDSSSAAPFSSPKLLVCVHSCYSILMCYDGVLLGY